MGEERIGPQRRSRVGVGSMVLSKFTCGRCQFHGELIDSTAYLATTTISLINFGMTSLKCII